MALKSNLPPGFTRWVKGLLKAKQPLGNAAFSPRVPNPYLDLTQGTPSSRLATAVGRGNAAINATGGMVNSQLAHDQEQYNALQAQDATSLKASYAQQLAQQQHDLNAMVADLHRQGADPATINQIVSQANAEMQATAQRQEALSAARGDRKTTRL